MKNKTRAKLEWNRNKRNYDYIGELIDYAESKLPDSDCTALKLVGFLYGERKRHAFLANDINTEYELGNNELV